MMSRIRSLIPVALLAFTSAGCGSGCLTFATDAVELTITDVATGIPAAGGATVVVTGPSFDKTVTIGTDSVSNRLPLGAGSKAGVYNVAIRKPGYVDWTRNGIRVEWLDEECGHARTERITVGLVKVK